jgi:RNA polymerase sigma factor (sigma-70 family)
MASGQLSTVLRHLHKLTDAAQAGGLTDAELLERFASRRDEAAFAALVKRHGPMVLAVCRRVLGNPHDAEDAFQATFLVLVRRACSLRREALGGWLHEVALRVALRARASAHSRRRHEQRAPDMPRKDFLATVVWRDLRPVLDEEVQGLPDACREAFVLCYLQGKTYEQAAEQLHCRPGTLSRRLGRARELLRLRLTRRGLVLPAGLLSLALSQQTAPAAVPAALIASTVKTTLRTAAGAIPARIAALAEGGLQAMRATQTKVALALFLTAGLALAGAAALACSAPADPGQASGAAPRAAAPGAAAIPQQQAGPAKEAAGAVAPKGVRVSGRVRGTDGKPLAGAEVALVGRWRPSPQKPGPDYEILSQGKADAEGRFRLARADLAPATFDHVDVLAGAAGRGLGWHRLPQGGWEKDVELRLEPERIVRGRLHDLQGLPAGGVKGRPVYLAWKDMRGLKGDRKQLERLQMMREFKAPLPVGGVVAVPRRRDGGIEFNLPKVPDGLALWPRGFTTDAQGRFEVRGLSEGQELHLVIEDDRFAPQELQVDTGGAKPPAEVSLSLAPPQRVEGRVVYADTGKPVAGAQVTLTSSRGTAGKSVANRTDAEGRFAMNAYPGANLQVSAWAPAGQPYLGVLKPIAWPKGAVRQTVEFALPRGVEVRGEVVEAASGKPRAQARVFFTPRGDDEAARANALLTGPNWPARTAADGSFRLLVPPGPGHLLVDADDPNFLVKATSRDELATGTPGGPARFYHEILPLNLKLQDGPKGLTLQVRRGVTLRGVVVGPDGKRVSDGTLILPGELRGTRDEDRGNCPVMPFLPGTPLNDGRFELPGCDPDRTYRIYVLDAVGLASYSMVPGYASLEANFGAMADISAAKAKGGEVTVRLQPCGAVAIRLRDAAGKPSPVLPWVELEVVPDRGKLEGERGPVVEIPKKVKAKAPPRPGAKGDEAGRLEMPKLTGEPKPRPKMDGRVTVRGLIPGATYRLRALDPQQSAVPVGEAFTVESGKTRKLPDAVAP